ncbi:hypothetical protein AAZX31_01G009400 [Glycine max]
MSWQWERARFFVVGGTGYVGRRIVKASLEQGHETYVLQRPEIGLDIEMMQMLLSFKKQGAHLVEASVSDHQNLVEAVKLVDVVICTMSGVHFLLSQLVGAAQTCGGHQGCREHQAVYMDEDDVATYTVKTIDYPRTLNKMVYLRPPENILTQRQLIEKWEKLIGKQLEKSSMNEQDFLASMEGLDYEALVGVGHFYHILL